MDTNDQSLRIERIQNGTVIDHIRPSFALTVINILQLSGANEQLITVGINVSSKSSKSGLKDIIKVEGQYLKEDQINQIALISPECTVSFIENYNVREKFVVTLPERITGILHCANPKCISRKAREPIKPTFDIIRKNPPKISCHYCNQVLTESDIIELSKNPL